VRDLRVQVKDLKVRQNRRRLNRRSTEELVQTRSQPLTRSGSPILLPRSAWSPRLPHWANINRGAPSRNWRGPTTRGRQDRRANQTKSRERIKVPCLLSGIVRSTRMVSADRWTTRNFPPIGHSSWLLLISRVFRASVRQSQIGIQAFGPTIAGARTSADIELILPVDSEDKRGRRWNRAIRTGTIRFDWTDTSVVGGQDSLFLFAPLSPTSIATLAIPALAYQEIFGVGRHRFG